MFFVGMGKFSRPIFLGVHVWCWLARRLQSLCWWLKHTCSSPPTPKAKSVWLVPRRCFSTKETTISDWGSLFRDLSPLMLFEIWCPISMPRLPLLPQSHGAPGKSSTPSMRWRRSVNQCYRHKLELEQIGKFGCETVGIYVILSNCQ